MDVCDRLGLLKLAGLSPRATLASRLRVDEGLVASMGLRRRRSSYGGVEDSVEVRG